MKSKQAIMKMIDEMELRRTTVVGMYRSDPKLKLVQDVVDDIDAQYKREIVLLLEVLEDKEICNKIIKRWMA